LQENQEGLELNGTDRFLTYADDIKLLNENINTIKRNKDALFIRC